MLSSDSNSDSDISPPMDESFSITKRLVATSIYKEDPFESSSNLTRNLIQMTTTYIPLIIASKSKKGPHNGSTPGRHFVPREREQRHELISKYYFMGENSKYSSKIFRRRFRMDEDLFDRILQAIKGYDNYFTEKVDTTGRSGLIPLQKMIAPLRMLAYGVPADYVDEYVQIGQNRAIESLVHFCDAVIGVFEEMYLRKSNVDYIAMLLKQNEA